MNRKIKGKLSVEGLRKIADQLNEYERVRLQKKCDELVDRLANLGIRVGRANVNTGFKKYITFTKQIEHTNYGAKSLMIAVENGQITSTWDQLGEVRVVNISPLLMAEFGAGVHAASPTQLPDGRMVGRGTYEHGVEPHANQNSWWYMDTEGNWHQGHGVKRTMPIHQAFVEMYKEVYEIAVKVFGRS